MIGFFGFRAMMTVRIPRPSTRGVFDVDGSSSGGGSSGSRSLEDGNGSGTGGNNWFRSTILNSDFVLKPVVNLLRVLCVTESHECG